jgi:Flp pilus assembly protein TadG
MTPLILVALYVPFDFGVTLFTGHLTQNAVRDGARIVSHTDSLDETVAGDLAEDVFDNLPELLVSGSTTKRVTVTYFADGAADCVQFVEVRAEGNYNFFLYRLIALLGFTPPDPVQIARTTRMRYEKQPDRNGGTGATTTICTTATASGSHPAI